MKIDCAYDQLVELHALKPHPKNNNRHSIEQINALAKIISYQGMRSPIVVSKNSGCITKGHARLEALKKLNWEKAPVDYQLYDNPEQEYADITADNEIARWAQLDMHAVYEEIKGFDNFDVTLLGIEDFKIPEIESIDPLTDKDEVPEVKEDPVTKRGDVWLLGDHRVMCGDSTVIDDVDKLMAGEKADMVFTDPPYNQNIGTPTSNKTEERNLKRSKILKESGLNDFDPEDFLSVLSAINVDSVYIFHSKDLIKDYISYFDNQKRNWELLAMTKNNPMPYRKGHYLNDIEWMIFSKKIGAFFNEKLDNSFYSKFRSAKQVNGKDNYHPTRKSVEYIEAYIQISSENTVLDLFSGSGSTLIACEKTNRTCYGMELDEHYCDVIINRWQNYTGKKAILESDGKTYDELKNQSKDESNGREETAGGKTVQDYRGEGQTTESNSQIETHS